MRKFALIEHEDELWLMDLHASDERVKFELYEGHKDSLIMSQFLLTPLPVQLTPGEIELIHSELPAFAKYGLKLEIVNSQVEVLAIPVYFDLAVTGDSILKILKEFLSLIGDAEQKPSVNTPLDKLEYIIVSRLACHGSLRSGKLVDVATIATILENLLKCRHPWTCAHGRPTILKIPKGTIENWFKRSGD